MRDNLGVLNPTNYPAIPLNAALSGQRVSEAVRSTAPGELAE
jgi:hypothetical protein